ncbi:hypothetical protein SAMN04489735_10574 [Aneurinibacillus thermoaerophilus]|uniref:Uncharacterized protein n=1 Tax=Aneurinibacillus thermoaerophilus TaxID=143495 RepID=A0A1G8F6A1_ANETH|nr:CD1375 family protein [Aneurinibacillus thermoaerophilus]SDH77529.1 hypothetical protein SAMN04489735_10574 [Aneurinibacillus thermoaerophilus]
MIKPYILRAYVYLVKVGRMDIETLPQEEYREPVAQYLIDEEMKNQA